MNCFYNFDYRYIFNFDYFWKNTNFHFLFRVLSIFLFLSEPPETDYNSQTFGYSLNNVEHRLIPTFESKCRKCTYCALSKTKTRSGWRPTTRHLCQACNVPLCKGGKGKNCFYLYHQMTFGDRLFQSYNPQN